jgi:hypothetical protein
MITAVKYLEQGKKIESEWEIFPRGKRRKASLER